MILHECDRLYDGNLRSSACTSRRNSCWGNGWRAPSSPPWQIPAGPCAGSSGPGQRWSRSEAVAWNPACLLAPMTADRRPAVLNYPSNSFCGPSALRRWLHEHSIRLQFDRFLFNQLSLSVVCLSCAAVLTSRAIVKSRSSSSSSSNNNNKTVAMAATGGHWDVKPESRHERCAIHLTFLNV